VEIIEEEAQKEGVHQEEEAQSDLKGEAQEEIIEKILKEARREGEALREGEVQAEIIEKILKEARREEEALTRIKEIEARHLKQNKKQRNQKDLPLLLLAQI
jgi:hypothetical protein